MLEHGTLGLKLRTLTAGHYIPIRKKSLCTQVSYCLFAIYSDVSAVYAMHASTWSFRLNNTNLRSYEMTTSFLSERRAASTFPTFALVFERFRRTLR